jgi:segregation and condensation protein B
VTSLAKLLEAALFASARPIATDELASLDPDASGAELQSALDEIREHTTSKDTASSSSRSAAVGRF